MRTQTVPAIAPGNRSWVLAAALGVSVCAGCDGNTGVGGGGAGGAGGDTGSGGEAGSSGWTTPHLLPWEGGDATLAFRRLDFGDVGPDGAPSPTGWAKVGLDLDGKSSTAGSTDLCKPAAGADAEKVHPDGEGGVDNSFGKNVLPVLAAVAPGFTQSTNALIEGGRDTHVVRILGSNAPFGEIPAQMYSVRFSAGTTPQWTGLDEWQVRSDCLADGNIDDPKVHFPKSYLMEGPSGERRWVSGSFGSLLLRLPVGDLTMSLYLHHSVMFLDLTAGNTKAKGLLVGILDAEQLIGELELTKLAPDDLLACPPNDAYLALVEQVRQASDIGIDGGQDPTATCDGISFGIGVEAEAAMLGPVVEPPLDPAPCGP